MDEEILTNRTLVSFSLNDRVHTLHTLPPRAILYQRLQAGPVLAYPSPVLARPSLSPSPMAVAMDTAAGNAPQINYEEFVLSLTLATGAEFHAREGSFVV